MSNSSSDSSSDTSFKDDNSNPTWENVKITNSLENTSSKQYDLLKIKTLMIQRSVTRTTTPLGDISFNIGIRKYTLDRAILASKSHQLRYLLVVDCGEKKFETEIGRLMNGDGKRFSNIVDIIYGKELEAVMTENNFAQLFGDMYRMKLEIDLEVFKKFIKKNIQRTAKLNERMFQFYRTLILNCPPANDYLLPILSQHISNHLQEIHDRKEFLSLPPKGFIRILLNITGNWPERDSIGHICAKWICQDVQERIEHLIDLVNAAKFRYDLRPYCNWKPDLVKFLQKNPGNEESQMKYVEKYFNELLDNHGEVSFAFPPNLKDQLGCTEPGDQKVHSINEIGQWMSFLKEGTFCDVAINVQGTIFKLHRVKLLLASEYFRDLFTNQINASTSEDKSNSKPSIKEYSLDQMDPVTFQSIIQYIYEHEIEITSQSHLISLIKGSKFLKMNALFEKCSSILLEIARNGVGNDIFEMFQYACEDAKYLELYGILSRKIIGLWEKPVKTRNFIRVSFETLKEILALPHLTLNNPNEILDFCSRWIFHDVENRYNRMIQVALAINRNFMIDSDKFELEKPSNPSDCTLHYIREQLTKVLSSTALVSFAECTNDRKTPKFLWLNEEKFLSVVDVNLNEIFQLVKIEETDYRYSATIIENELFILFHENDQFNFQSYSITTDRLISLATDTKMGGSQYVLLSCNNKVYYCDQYEVLEYDTKLNRWIYLFNVNNESESVVKYTSDGKRIYKMFIDNNQGWNYKADFYDFQRKEWTALPSMPGFSQNFLSNTDNDVYSVKVNIISNEICVMFPSKMERLNWMTRKWYYTNYPNEKFVEFTGHEDNILFISDQNEVHVYSPVHNKWTLKRKLDNVSDIVAIHAIGK